MKAIKCLLPLVIISFFASPSFAQFSKVNKQFKKYQKTQTAAVKRAVLGPEKVITAHNQVYILPVEGHKAGWRKPRTNELQNRKKQKAKFLYELNLRPSPHSNGKPSRGARGPWARQIKKVPFHNLKENKGGLNDGLIKRYTVGNKNAKAGGYTNTSAYYFKNVHLEMISFLPYMNHIIVTDTLFVPVAGAGRSLLFAGYRNQNKQHIKIVANVIVYESPVTLSGASISTDLTTFVFSANKYIYKSVHKGLNQQKLITPLYKPIESRIKGYINKMGNDESELLRRLYYYSMMQVLNKLDGHNLTQKQTAKLLAEYRQYQGHNVSNKLLTQKQKTDLDRKEALVMNWIYTNELDKIITDLNVKDTWEEDQLLIEFQTIRRKQIDEALLEKDIKTKKLFNETCQTFQVLYGNKGKQELREEDGMRIIVDGSVEKLHKEPFKYYMLPGNASLLPVNNQNSGHLSALGFIHYNPTGDSKFELEVDVELSYDQKVMETAKEKLKKYGLTLQESFPAHLAEIKEQRLKINGKPMGRIIPLGNQNVRFEIELEDDKFTLLELFAGRIKFDIDYNFKANQQIYSQTIRLEIDPSILNNMDPDQVLESFSVIEKSNMTENIMLTSHLEKAITGYDLLNYVEVVLEVQFENRTISMGPYRLSSSSLDNAKKLVDFVKYSEDYTLTVSGQAFYENGVRDIKEYSATSKIITLSENIFE